MGDQCAVNWQPKTWHWYPLATLENFKWHDDIRPGAELLLSVQT